MRMVLICEDFDGFAARVWPRLADLLINICVCRVKRVSLQRKHHTRNLFI